MIINDFINLDISIDEVTNYFRKYHIRCLLFDSDIQRAYRRIQMIIDGSREVANIYKLDIKIVHDCVKFLGQISVSRDNGRFLLDMAILDMLYDLNHIRRRRSNIVGLFEYQDFIEQLRLVYGR